MDAFGWIVIGVVLVGAAWVVLGRDLPKSWRHRSKDDGGPGGFSSGGSHGGIGGGGAGGVG